MTSLPSTPIVRHRRAQSAHSAMQTTARPPTVFIPVHVQGKALNIPGTAPQLPAGAPVALREDHQRHTPSTSLGAESARDENDDLVVAPASSPRGEQSTSARLLSNLVAAVAADLQGNEVAENESVACTAGATPTADLESVASDIEEDGPAIQVTVKSPIVENSTRTESHSIEHKELSPVNNKLERAKSARPATRAVEKVDRSFNVPSLSGEESNMADVEDQQLLSNVSEENVKSETTSNSLNAFITEKENVEIIDAETTAVDQQDVASRPTSALSKKSLSLHRVSSAKKVRFADENTPSSEELLGQDTRATTAAASSKRPGSAKTGIVRHNTWNDNSTAPATEPLAPTAHAINRPTTANRSNSSDNTGNESDIADSGLKWKDLREMPTERHLSNERPQDDALSSDKEN